VLIGRFERPFQSDVSRPKGTFAMFQTEIHKVPDGDGLPSGRAIRIGFLLACLICVVVIGGAVWSLLAWVVVGVDS
jgi:hypothetical protein